MVLHDVKRLAPYVCTHRLIPSGGGGRSTAVAEAILAEIVEAIPAQSAPPDTSGRLSRRRRFSGEIAFAVLLWVAVGFRPGSRVSSACSADSRGLWIGLALGTFLSEAESGV